MLPQTVARDRSVSESDRSAREVVSELRAAGIPCCLLRPSLDPESPAGDLDLLVEESAILPCRHWLEERGFVAVPGRSPFKLVMLRYRQGQVLILDIHWKAVQYGILVHGRPAHARPVHRV